MFDNDDSSDSRAFGVGLILGALVGAGAALLLAPESGQQTRKKLKKGAARIYSQTEDLAGELWNDADRSTRDMRKSASRQLKRGMKRSRKYASDAADYVESGGKRFGWR